MMKAVFEDKKGMLKSIFKDHRDLFKTIQIDANSGGMVFEALSRDKVSYSKLEIERRGFEYYEYKECNVPVNVRVSVSMEEFGAAVGAYNSSDYDLIQLKIGDEGFLEISYLGDSQRKFHLQAKTSELIKTVSSPGYTCVEMPTETLETGINGLADFDIATAYAEYRCYVLLDENSITFRTNSNNGSYGEMKYLHGEKVDGISEAIFGLGRIYYAVLASKFNESVLVSVGDDLPIRFSWKGKYVEFNYIVAPLVDRKGD